MTWDRWLYFPSKGRRAEDFFTLKNPDGFGRVWTRKLGISRLLNNNVLAPDVIYLALENVEEVIISNKQITILKGTDSLRTPW